MEGKGSVLRNAPRHLCSFFSSGIFVVSDWSPLTDNHESDTEEPQEQTTILS